MRWLRFEPHSGVKQGNGEGYDDGAGNGKVEIHGGRVRDCRGGPILDGLQKNEKFCFTI